VPLGAVVTGGTVVARASVVVATADDVVSSAVVVTRSARPRPWAGGRRTDLVKITPGFVSGRGIVPTDGI
jgi:hypothetical protein